MMVSPHYPFLSAHPQSWLVVALIIIAGALIRHFINRVDAGDDSRAFDWTLPLAAFALICAIWLTAPRAPAATGAAVSDTEVLALTAKHCAIATRASRRMKASRKRRRTSCWSRPRDLRKYAAADPDPDGAEQGDAARQPDRHDR